MQNRAPDEVTRDDARLVTLTSPGRATGNNESEHMATAPDVGKSDTGRVSSLLGSPRGIMILVPLLVFALGTALTVVGQIALSATSRTMARDSFVTHTTSVTHDLDNVLGQAEPLLDELSRIALAAKTLSKDERKEDHPVSESDPTLNAAAAEMRNLLVGRLGITQGYIAFSDGLFLSANSKKAGAVDIQVTYRGVVRDFRFEGSRLIQTGVHPSNFDPRRRNWYAEAERTKERLWSRPYKFYFNHHTGVTRAQPLYEGERLFAVAGIDFDVNALTAFMAQGENPESGIQSVLFTRNGIVLAYPTAAERLSELQEKGEIVSHQALGDPHVSSLVKRVQHLGPLIKRRELLSFTSGEERMLGALRRVGAGGPNWYVATFAAEKSVLKELYDHRQSSLLIAFLSLWFAVVLAWFLARRLLHVRRAAERAQVAAQAAQDQIRDLGSYRLVDLIGEGGMGEVWRANHRLLARDAAIKLIKTGLFGEKRQTEQRERFRREAQAIARLRSRNTVALFDYGVTPEGTLFYVMELLDGIDLSTLVRDHGPQPAERVRKILIQACNSLAEAHEAKLVHRDIKPANLFLCREAEEVDVVKVLDFGLVFEQSRSLAPRSSPDHAGELPAEDGAPPDFDVANLDTYPTEEVAGVREVSGSAPESMGRITQAEHHLGTPAFMSPEQALGAPMDGRSDLYSLACVGYYLCCGKPPFHADTPVSIMLQHVEEEPPLLTELGADASPEFALLLRECLSKSPLDRPQTAQELARRLRALGPQPQAFDEEQARLWWREHQPEQQTKLSQNSLPPLRDAELLPPKSAPQA